MAEQTIEVSLAKALKLKNRLTGRIAQWTNDIKAYNSRQEGAEMIDVPRRFVERARFIEQLIDLKTAINQVNQPIQKTIYQLAERKALLAMLSEINTTHGAVIQYHQQMPVQFVAQLRKEQLDQERLRIEQEIDTLQDELDRYNALTTLRVTADLLQLPADNAAE